MNTFFKCSAFQILKMFKSETGVSSFSYASFQSWSEDKTKDNRMLKTHHDQIFKHLFYLQAYRYVLLFIRISVREHRVSLKYEVTRLFSPLLWAGGLTTYQQIELQQIYTRSALNPDLLKELEKNYFISKNGHSHKHQGYGEIRLTRLTTGGTHQGC